MTTLQCKCLSSSCYHVVRHFLLGGSRTRNSQMELAATQETSLGCPDTQTKPNEKSSSVSFRSLTTLPFGHCKNSLLALFLPTFQSLSIILLVPMYKKRSMPRLTGQAMVAVCALLVLLVQDCSAWLASLSWQTAQHHSSSIIMMIQNDKTKRQNGILNDRNHGDATFRLFAADGVASSEASSSSSPSTTTTTTSGNNASLDPVKGRVVSIACRLEPEGDFVPEPLIDGIVLHEDDPTVDLRFVLGWGNYLPGLHDLVAEMKVGETRTGISMDAGWGDRNPDLIVTVPFEGSGLDPSQIKVGTQLFLATQNVPCSVTEVTDTTFTIDANPPLAGASYKATVTLKAVEEGPVITPYSEESSGTSRFEVATFALGCFWGGELEFMRQPGVVGTAVGFTQGQVENPSYEQVCSGTTGHTEAIAVMYDPSISPYEMLVDVAMDRLGENKYLPNQVGNDKGTQYRHGVYYHTPSQKKIAEKVVAGFGSDCVTECLPAKIFYKAEDYHQQYLLKGGQSARKGDTTVIRCYG